MTGKRVLPGVSGVTALCCAMVLVSKAVGPVLEGALNLLLPGRRREAA